MGHICFPTDVEWSMVRLRLCSHQVDVYTPKTITYVYIYSLFILPIHTINIPIAFYGGQCICVKYYICMFFFNDYYVIQKTHCPLLKFLSQRLYPSCEEQLNCHLYLFYTKIPGRTWDFQHK